MFNILITPKKIQLNYLKHLKLSKFKKYILLFYLVLSIFITPYSYANIEDDESFNYSSLYEETIETTSNIADIPLISSRYSVVLERNSKSILFEKNKDTKTPMASTTKIMTALIVIENADLNKTITISSKAANTGGSRLGLSKDAKITIRDLLYGLMLCSGNDAAVALAETVGGNQELFADLMNNKAKEIGLSNTHFVTPHGLDNSNHYTTAYELAILTDYALNNETFANIVKTKTYTITINGYPKTISNTNELLGNLNGVYGVKTGFTNGANRCLVTATKRNNLNIICIVLGADTKKIRTQDSIRLIEYCFNNFETIDISNNIDNFFNDWNEQNKSNFKIEKGTTNSVNTYIEKPQNPFITIKKNELQNINYIINANYNYIAPLYKDEIIGTLKIYNENQNIFSINIKNKETISKKNTYDYYYYFIKNYIAIISTKI